MLDYNGEPLFAELYALKLFQNQGYDGVWADTYRKTFRAKLPEKQAKKIVLPGFIKDKILEINPDGKLSGTWDLIPWKENRLKFVELKRKGKDKIRNTQIYFLERALKCGFRVSDFEIFEWEERK